MARMEGEWDRLTPAERLLVECLRSRRERRLAQALQLLQDLERLVPTSFLVNFNLVQNAVMVNRPRVAVDAYRQASLR